MSAVLHSITDPRDGLDKMKRLELFRLARDYKVSEIPDEQMPGDLMRQILRSKGIRPGTMPQRTLGSPEQTFTTPSSHRTGPQEAPRAPDKVAEVDAMADLARQWKAQQEQQPRPVAEMTITEMRKECKRRGIKLERRDNMISLKAKLNGENAS